jgi:hypothetical protein
MSSRYNVITTGRVGVDLRTQVSTLDTTKTPRADYEDAKLAQRRYL